MSRAGGERVLEVLRRHAPSWRAQMPGAEVRGDTRGHMLRELAEALEALAADSVVIEVMEHCEKGLELLEWLPGTPEHQRQELALRTLLSTVLTVTCGFAAKGLVQNLTRARELCQALNDDVILVPVSVARGRKMDRKIPLQTLAEKIQENRFTHLVVRFFDGERSVEPTATFAAERKRP